MSASLAAPGTFVGALVAESASEVRKAVRVPAFIIPVLVFPALFYVMFGLLIGGSMPLAGLTAPSYLLASYGTFGVVGAALFGMGVGVAAERGQGWMLLKRATPMPPLAYFGGKVFMSAAIGFVIAVVLALLAAMFGEVTLPPARWALLLLVLTVGGVPFCALGCALGYVAGPNSAPPLANLIYLPMSLASGLWIPVEFMPELVRDIAPLMPPYHLARLALSTIGAPVPVLQHAAALVLSTAVFLALAVAAYRRDDGRTWG